MSKHSTSSTMGSGSRATFLLRFHLSASAPAPVCPLPTSERTARQIITQGENQQHQQPEHASTDARPR